MHTVPLLLNSPAISKAPVLVMIAEGVPEPEGHIHTVHYRPGPFQHLKCIKASVAKQPIVEKALNDMKRQLQDDWKNYATSLNKIRYTSI